FGVPVGGDDVAGHGQALGGDRVLQPPVHQVEVEAQASGGGPGLVPVDQVVLDGKPVVEIRLGIDVERRAEDREGVADALLDGGVEGQVLVAVAFGKAVGRRDAVRV